MADSTVTPSSTKKPRGRGVTMCRKLAKVRHTDPDKDPLRKVWFQFAGDRWRGFKAQLTREYVTKPDEAPYVRYTYISKAVWEKFLASRDTPEFKDSLVEETEKGTFVPNGHNDILTNAIGTAEHGGRVRGAG
ncbi:hypothetical protein QL285_094718 [Trifolium repens]|nr:hypothetical protein QL285_094718 [Trifolium repens]